MTENKTFLSCKPGNTEDMRDFIVNKDSDSVPKPKQLRMELIDENARIVKGWATVEIKDRQGEIIPMSDISKIMPVIMDRGGIILRQHSNRPVAKILNYELAEHPKYKKPGLKLTVKVFNNYELDDQAWTDIKEGKITGFSFGGSAKDKADELQDDGGYAKRLVGVEGYEFSFVDRPANQGALIEEVNYVAKADTQKTENKQEIINFWNSLDNDEKGDFIEDDDVALKDPEFSQLTPEQQARVIEDYQNIHGEIEKACGKKKGVKKMLASFVKTAPEIPASEVPKRYDSINESNREILENELGEKLPRKWDELSGEQKRKVISAVARLSKIEKDNAGIRKFNGGLEEGDAKVGDYVMVSEDFARYGHPESLREFSGQTGKIVDLNGDTATIKFNNGKSGTFLLSTLETMIGKADEKPHEHDWKPNPEGMKDTMYCSTCGATKPKEESKKMDEPKTEEPKTEGSQLPAPAEPTPAPSEPNPTAKPLPEQVDIATLNAKLDKIVELLSASTSIKESLSKPVEIAKAAEPQGISTSTTPIPESTAPEAVPSPTRDDASTMREMLDGKISVSEAAQRFRK